MFPQVSQTMASCPVCGKPAKRKYCSQACHATTRRAGAKHACLSCGQEFYAKAVEVKRGGGIFCSMKCRRGHKSLHGKAYTKKGTRSVHRLVMSAKIGRDLSASEVVHHLDHDRKNNHPGNLELLPSQSAHMRLHARCGEDSSWAKLTWDKVREIRRRYAAGERSPALAAEFRVDPSNVRLIVRGVTWKE